MAEVNAPAADIFMKNLQEHCEGLFYLSESEYPLEPIIFEVTDAAAVTNADVQKLTGQPADAPVEVVDLSYFFRNQTAVVPDADEFIQGMVNRFRDLQNFLLTQLQEVNVYRIGRREIQVYVLGKLNQTRLAGFKTISVET